MSADPSWTRDELILACDLTMDNNWIELREHDPRVAELSSLLRRMPIHPPERRGPSFRSVGSVSRKTTDIMTVHPDYRGKATKGGTLTKKVLADFLNEPILMRQAAATIRALVPQDSVASAIQLPAWDVAFVDDVDFREGALLAARHFRRERSPKLRKQKVAQFLAAHSRLFCEICGFDFEDFYGPHGAGYIECHHTVPLHVSGETRTRLADLILLCSNCHRMIHYRSHWLTPQELLEHIGHVERMPVDLDTVVE